MAWIAKIYGFILKAILLSTVALTNHAHAGKPSWAGGGGKDGGGNGSNLTAPLSFSATATSTSQIGLGWGDPNDGETGFEIERSLSTSAGFSLIATTGKNVTSYSNSGLASGTTYYYRIRSVGRKGKTSGYVYASATTDSQTTDTQPPAVSISPATSQTYTSAQTIAIGASASDNVSVDRVEFWNGNSLKKIDSAAPYSYSWGVTETSNGSHSWKTVAYDVNGNASEDSVVLMVDITPADTQSPSVSISPATSQTYTSAQTVSITASASDNVGVSKVEFWDGGTLKKIDTMAPYSYDWAVTESANGSHSWQTVAFDAAGNSSQDSVVLTVDITPADTQSPSVSISPGSSQTYTSAQTVTISATASDNVGVSKVEFWDGGTLKKSDTTLPYSYNWAVSESTNGSHSWKTVAYDAAGNSSQDSVMLTVDITPADTESPSVAISPATSQTYTSAQTVSITASAFDNVGVSKVEFWDGGTLKKTDTTAPYSYDWTVSEAGNGSHSWKTVAFDAAGNSSQDSVMLTVDITPADTQSPSVYISPGSNQTYTSAQTVTISASASDNVGVARVEFWRGSTRVKTDTSSPYDVSWSFTSSNNGTHSWKAIAYDAAGNSRQDSVSLTVNISTSSASGGDHIWSQAFGGTRVDKGQAVAINRSNGDVVMTGYYANSASFGGNTLSCSGIRNLVIAKYNDIGNHLWSRCADSGSGVIIANDVAVDASGNVAVIGEFSGTVSFGGQSLSSAGGTDMFVARYSASGTLQWVKRQGSTNTDKGFGVAIDGSGNIVTTGGFQNPDVIYLTKYSASGSLQWSREFTGQGSNAGRDVAVDGQGNIFMTGAFLGTIQLDNSSLTLTSTTSWYPDVLVAKFTAAGNPLWVKRTGGDGEERSMSIAVDSATGESAITGYFGGTSNFGQGSVSSISYDMFLVKFDAAGNVRWSRVFSGFGNNLGNGVAIGEQSGDVFLTGAMGGDLSLGGPTLSLHGGNDLVVARFRSGTGAHAWSKAFGGSYSDDGRGIAVDEAGDQLMVTGSFVSSINFGGGTLSGDPAYGDIFLLQLAP